MKKINQTINWKEESFRYAKDASSSSKSYKKNVFEKHFKFFLILDTKNLVEVFLKF